MGDEEMVWLRIPVDQAEEIVAALYGVARELQDEVRSSADPDRREVTRSRLSRLVETMRIVQEAANGRVRS